MKQRICVLYNSTLVAHYILVGLAGCPKPRDKYVWLCPRIKDPTPTPSAFNTHANAFLQGANET